MKTRSSALLWRTVAMFANIAVVATLIASFMTESVAPIVTDIVIVLLLAFTIYADYRADKERRAAQKQKEDSKCSTRD